MPGGYQNEPTYDGRVKVTRSRFEQNVVKYDTPPWYLKPDRHEKETGDEQVRLVVNSFRGKEYLHFRKYYLDFEGEWQPSKEGISMPLGLSNSREMFSALVEILSLTENKTEVYNHFSDLIEDLYN